MKKFDPQAIALYLLLVVIILTTLFGCNRPYSRELGHDYPYYERDGNKD